MAVSSAEMTMGVQLSAQLMSYLTAVALGLAGGAVYDLMGLVRLRRRKNRRLTHALDTLFLLLVIPAALWFALRIGEGELRLVMLTGMGLGAVVYALALRPVFRPLWDFWLTAAVATARLLLLPVRLGAGLVKKAALAAKKAFSFLPKWSMIEKTTEKREAQRHGRSKTNEAAQQHGAAAGAGRLGHLFGRGAGAGTPAATGGTGAAVVPDPAAPAAAAGERGAGE